MIDTDLDRETIVFFNFLLDLRFIIYKLMSFITINFSNFNLFYFLSY